MESRHDILESEETAEPFDKCKNKGMDRMRGSQE